MVTNVCLVVMLYFVVFLEGGGCKMYNILTRPPFFFIELEIFAKLSGNKQRICFELGPMVCMISTLCESFFPAW